MTGSIVTGVSADAAQGFRPGLRNSAPPGLRHNDGWHRHFLSFSFLSFFASSFLGSAFFGSTTSTTNGGGVTA